MSASGLRVDGAAFFRTPRIGGAQRDVGGTDDDDMDEEEDEDEGSLMLLRDSGAVPNGAFRPRSGIRGGMFSLSSWLAIAFATAALLSRREISRCDDSCGLFPFAGFSLSSKMSGASMVARQELNPKQEATIFLMGKKETPICFPG